MLYNLHFFLFKCYLRGLLEKYPTFAREKKLAYLKLWTPNHPQNSSLGTPHISPSVAAIVGSMPKKPLPEWSLARLSLLP
jgi:hypothetical protein